MRCTQVDRSGICDDTKTNDRSAQSDVVAAPVFSTSIEAAERVAWERFRIRAIGRRLSSERDENFHLLTESSEAYVLKITNAAESRQVTDFQTGALLHVARTDPGLPVPRLVPASDGAHEVVMEGDGVPQRIVRLMTFLKGDVLHNATRSAAQSYNVGLTLGRLQLALRAYEHPASGHELRWDLKHASSLRPLLSHITNLEQRALAERFLGNFEKYALPVLPSLRSQVIHNDFQPSNILVDSELPSRVTGIIDFGDMVAAPLINDVAVASAYHIAAAPAPLDYVAALVNAFNSVVPLHPEEVAILFDLIVARLVMTVAITNWRADRHPDNRDYILRNAPASWRALERCTALPRDQAKTILRAACQLE